MYSMLVLFTLHIYWHYTPCFGVSLQSTGVKMNYNMHRCVYALPFYFDSISSSAPSSSSSPNIWQGTYKISGKYLKIAVELSEIGSQDV